MLTQADLISRIKVFVCILVGYMIISCFWSGIEAERIPEYFFVGSVSAIGLALMWPMLLRFVYRLTNRILDK